VDGNDGLARLRHTRIFHQYSLPGRIRFSKRTHNNREMSCTCSCCFGPGCTRQPLPALETNRDCNVELCREKYPASCGLATSVQAKGSGSLTKVLAGIGIVVGILLGAAVIAAAYRRARRTRPILEPPMT
jgi:hypothetical protein